MHAYCAEIWNKRYFWFSLVQMDLRRRYRRSVLGIGWSLLNPLLMTSVFCTVFGKMFAESIEDYAPFVLSGLAVWTYFSSLTSEGCHCYYISEHYIRQRPTPLAIYPLRTALGLFTHLGLALCVLLAMTWYFKGFGNLPALWSLVPALVLIFLFGWAIAVCTGMLNVVFPDMQHLIQVGMQILFYLTPVFYSGQMIARYRLQWLMDCNPLAACIALVRAPILEGHAAPLHTWGFAAAAVAVFGGIAAFTLSRMERRLVYHL